MADHSVGSAEPAELSRELALGPSEIAAWRQRLGSLPLGAATDPDLLLTTSFDERRAWEQASEQIRATLDAPVSNSLSDFLS